MSLYGLFKRPGPNGFGYNTTAEDVTDGMDLSGKTYLVTGCNSGLGYETMRVLCLRGAQVIWAARNLDKANAACDEVSGETIPLACDLSEPDSVRAAAKTVEETGIALAGVIANAGIMALPKLEQKHGFELQFLTNHIGHSILVLGVLDQLAEDGRVVMLSSAAHTGTYAEGIRFDDLSGEREKYTAWGAYGQSKLANLLFAKHLATCLPHPGQGASSVHPGVINTNLSRHIPAAARAVFSVLGPALALKSTPQGAATQVYAATHPDRAGDRGEYLADCDVATASNFGQDAELAARLWDVTQEILKAL